MTKEKKSIKAVMLDMDGTFYMGGNVLLPGALELMSFLNEGGRYRFHFLPTTAVKVLMIMLKTDWTGRET